MKKKLLVLVAVLLCAVTVFCSCGGSSDFDLMFDRNSEYEEMYPTLTNATALDIVGEPDDYNGDLVLFVGEDANGNSVYTVYDMAAGAVVWTATNSENAFYRVFIDDAGDFYMPENVFAVLKMISNEDDDVTVEASVYDRKGTCFWTFTGDEDEMEKLGVPYVELDLIGIDGQMFRIAEDGTVSKAFDYTPFRSLPNPTAAMGDYYYEFIDSSDGRMASLFSTYSCVNVYNSKLELITSIQAPAYAANGGIMVNLLNNGNVLVQYLMLEDEYATEYTFLGEDGDKYTLVTYCVNVRSNTTETIDVDHIYMYVFARDSKDGIFSSNVDIWNMVGLNRSLENVALYIAIENKRIAMSDDFGINDAVGVALSNNGTVERTLDNIISNQSFLAARINEKHWLVGNKVEQVFLINDRGENLGEVTNIMDEGYYYSDYLLYDGKIYDWDLNVKLDLDTLNLDYVEFCTPKGVVFWNEDGALLMAMPDGNVKTLITKEASDSQYIEEYYYTNEGYFVILDESVIGNTKATFYNAAGDAIYTAEYFYDSYDYHYAESNNNVLIELETYKDGYYKTTYVLLSAAAE